MTEVLSDFSVQKLEINCGKKLHTFVNKLNQYAKVLKKHIEVLKHIAGNLEKKSQQIQKLEHIKYIII